MHRTCTAAVLLAASLPLAHAGDALAAKGRAPAAASVTISPLPGTPTAMPRTQISFLGAAPGTLSSISVVGSSSGRHRGRLRPYSCAEEADLGTRHRRGRAGERGDRDARGGRGAALGGEGAAGVREQQACGEQDGGRTSAVHGASRCGICARRWVCARQARRILSSQHHTGLEVAAWRAYTQAA